MNRIILYLRVAGMINLLLAVFHGFIPLIFGWPAAVSILDPDNYGIYTTMVVVSVLLLSFLALVNLWLPESLLSEKLGRPVLLLAHLFYLARLGAEFVFFIPDITFSPILVILCLFMIWVYTMALHQRKRIVLADLSSTIHQKI